MSMKELDDIIWKMLSGKGLSSLTTSLNLWSTYVFAAIRLEFLRRAR